MQSVPATMPAPLATDARRRGLVFRALLAVGLLFVLLHASATLFLLSAHGDELHFCHAAWLWQHGEEPFVDFLYSSTPGVLWLLSVPQFCGFDDGPWLIVWGRFVAVASLWICSWLLYRLGTLVRNETVGLLAPLFYVPLVVVPNVPGFWSASHWMVRPETYAMPFCLYSVLATLRCLTAAEPRQSFRAGFLPAAALSVALFVSPRAAGIAVGLLVAVLWQRRALSSRAIAGMCVGAAIGVVALMLFVGAQNSYFWVYKFSASPMPGSPFVPMFQQQIGSLMICAAVAAGLLYVLRRTAPALGLLSLIVLVGFGLTILESQPSYASWYVTQPLAAVVFAALAYDLFRSHRVAGPIVAVAAVLLCWCYPMRGVSNNVAVYRRGSSILIQQIEGFEKICQTLGEERVLWNYRSHPIGLFDASYYWTFFRALPDNLPADPSGKVVPPFGLIDDCIRVKPAVIFEEALFPVQNDPAEFERFAELLNNEYDWNDLGFYVRTDMVSALSPLLANPDLRFFAKSNYSLKQGPRRAEDSSNR